jgi:hypothetical protein
VRPSITRAFSDRPIADSACSCPVEMNITTIIRMAGATVMIILFVVIAEGPRPDSDQPVALSAIMGQTLLEVDQRSE